MKFYITTPIYYVNDKPHIGHSYTTVIADIIARWKRLSGYEVFFLTGTDEHGLKVMKAAKAHNKSPSEYCDLIASEFKLSWEKLNISYDNFIRTSSEQHKKVVSEVLKQLFKKKSLYKKRYVGSYCVECEQFIGPDELIDEKCPVHLIKPVSYSEENYFFKLSNFRDEILNIIKNSPPMDIAPPTRKNEIIGKLKTKIPDLSISREKIKWGIPLPFDNSQTTYVWIDALINYLSGIGYIMNPEMFNKWWPPDLHLIGKDILWFHVVLWPAILKTLGLKLPQKVFCHGFFTLDGKKMSKTLGNIIRPEELISIFGSDATRFLIAFSFPLERDGDISISDFKERYTSELVNNLGNLANRIFSMVSKYNSGRILKCAVDVSLLKELNGIMKSYSENMEDIKVYESAKIILSLSALGNKYVDRMAPWKVKDKNKLNSILYNSLLILKVISFLSLPFMPTISKKMWGILDERISPTDFYKRIPDSLSLTGERISKYEILFPKIQ